MLQKLKEKIKKAYYYSALSVFVQMLINIFVNRPYYYLWHKTKSEFTASKPQKKQNYIIVSNHVSMKDPPAIGLTLGQPVAFIAKKELFENLFLKLFMWSTSTIKVDREKPDSSTFKESCKALKSQGLGLAWCSVVFIEGTRSKSGTLGKPNKGPMFLARLAKVPIIPCSITYGENREINIKFGEPYEIDYKGDLDEQAWQCLEKISELSGLEMPEKV